MVIFINTVQAFDTSQHFLMIQKQVCVLCSCHVSCYMLPISQLYLFPKFFVQVVLDTVIV